MNWYGFNLVANYKPTQDQKGDVCFLKTGKVQNTPLVKGLTAEDKVTFVAKDSEDGSNDIIMPLVQVTVCKNTGTMVAPGNKDLPCLLNGQTLVSEANLLPGSVIEVGDKQLEFCDGPLPRPRRRCLPPTPGVPIMPEPPPKPQRISKTSFDEEGVTVVKTRPTSFRKPPPLPNDWVIIELPSTDAELLKQTRRPEQLASLAGSYITKYLHLHTDARMTSELTDSIFKAMNEVALHGRSILQRFLTDLIEEQANGSIEDDKPADPSHGAVIILLREILRQFLDPPSLVEVSLLMLRALSHVPGATQTLVDCEVTSAVLGTMAALRTAATIQQYCLDVLAKIALYHPSISQKAPLRESGTDLICMALQSHSRNVPIAQAACRALANMAHTFYAIISSKLDNCYAASKELEDFVTSLLSILDYLYSTSLPTVQDILKNHSSDLTIKTEGRRFLFIYAKLEQLKQRRDLWSSTLVADEKPPPLPARSHEQTHHHSGSDEESERVSKRIIKRSRSFENLRTPERKVTFDEAAAPESDVSSSSSSPTARRAENFERDENPVEILSQRIIQVPKFSDSSPDTPTSEKTVIAQDSFLTEMGNRPDAEGSDSPFNHSVEYENWDLLRGVLRKKSGLKGHKYTAEDLKFMTQLAKTQVVALVCALAVDGNVPGAVRLVDQPISKMVLNTEVPPGVRDFINRQYGVKDSLMDLDPGLLVRIIDIVKYRSLSYEMAQKAVLKVVGDLNDKQHAQVVAVTVEFLASTITNRQLAPAMTVPSFVEEVCQELERARKLSQNGPALSSLLSEIKLCSKKNAER